VSAVRACALPAAALLQRYAVAPGYADCWTSDVERTVTQAAYVEAFYTTPLFKLERTVLKWLAGRASSDDDAGQLARGTVDTFAVWQVEDRRDDQLLLADMTGRTRSWLMTAPAARGGTQLYFGSAVLPRHGPRDGRPSVGGAFSALLGVHRLYSRLLLGAASARLLHRT
jgi:hypothetical protein